MKHLSSSIMFGSVAFAQVSFDHLGVALDFRGDTFCDFLATIQNGNAPPMWRPQNGTPVNSASTNRRIALWSETPIPKSQTRNKDTLEALNAGCGEAEVRPHFPSAAAARPVAGSRVSQDFAAAAKSAR